MIIHPPVLQDTHPIHFFQTPFSSEIQNLNIIEDPVCEYESAKVKTMQQISIITRN